MQKSKHKKKKKVCKETTIFGHSLEIYTENAEAVKKTQK